MDNKKYTDNKEFNVNSEHITQQDLLNSALTEKAKAETKKLYLENRLLELQTNPFMNLALIKKAESETRKADIEGQILSFQLSKTYRRVELFKNFAATSGLIVAFVTVIGALVSVPAWFYTQYKERNLRIEERLERAFLNLADQSIQKRAASLAMLRSFVGTDDEQRDRQIILAINQALVLETSPEVTNSIIAFLSQTTNAHINARNDGLFALAEESRRVASKFAYTRRDYINNEDPKLASIAAAMAALLRGGARADLNGVGLANQNLSGIDISGINLNRSLLENTDFSNTIAIGAKFSGALLASANFRDADLTGSDFSQMERVPGGQNYIIPTIGGPGKSFSAYFPDFTCANLKGANFKRHPLITIALNEFNETIYGSSVSFEGANLDQADFGRIAMIGLSRTQGMRWPIPTGNVDDNPTGTEINENGIYISTYKISVDRALDDNLPADIKSRDSEYSKFSRTYDHIRHIFTPARWKYATFPPSILSILKNSWMITTNTGAKCLHNW